MSYRSSSGRRFFNPAKEVENGVWTSGVSWRPLFEVQGHDGSPSWAIDRRVFWLDLPQYGVHTIRKVDSKTGTIYEVSYEDFAKFGKEGNWSHGDQIALPFCYWKVSRSPRTSRTSKRSAKPKKAKILKPAKTWLQISFFGG